MSNFKVVKQFVKSVEERAVGQDVLSGHVPTPLWRYRPVYDFLPSRAVLPGQDGEPHSRYGRCADADREGTAEY